MGYDNIQFFSEDITYTLRKKQAIRQWITETVNQEGKKTGYLNFIFCSDNYLQLFNQFYLHDQALTDVITFNYSESEEVISGDVYMSLERIRENALKYHISLKDEIHRVMIHGVLHLVGYTDMSREQKKNMHRVEDKYLTLRPLNL
jgi:probable rRNA maturation factor